MWCWTSLPTRQTSRGRSDAVLERARWARPRGGNRGAALPAVLVWAALLVGVTGWLLGHLRTDVLLGRAADEDASGVRLAGAAAAVVAMALGEVADWRPVDGLNPGVPCPAPPAPVTVVDEAAERAWAQAATDAASRWAAETPRWQLAWQCHAAAVLARWPGPGMVPAVLVWVADDPEGDGLPLRSSNGRLLLRASALGPGGARSVVTGTIGRAAPGSPVTLVSWRPRPAG